MVREALKILQKKMKLMSGISKEGFTLIELMVVIMLLGIIAAIVGPNMRRRLPKQQREAFISNVNTLLGNAWQYAVQRQKIVRVHFDFEKNLSSLQEQTDTKDIKGDAVFKPIEAEYRTTQYRWPDNIEIKQFFINGVNEMTSGKSVTKMWFFIIPDGMSQEVIINAVDTKEQRADDSDVQIGLVLNPFSAQLKSYGSFQKP